MAPIRLDRSEVRLQMDGVPAWITNELLNRYEPEALAALQQAREAKAEDSKTRSRARRASKDENP